MPFRLECSDMHTAGNRLIKELLYCGSVLLALAAWPTLAAEETTPTAAAAQPQTQLPLPIEEVRIFAQVLNQIRNSYVEPIDDQTLLENAIKGMLAGIDPHSTYLANDDYDQLQESTTGEFGG